MAEDFLGQSVESTRTVWAVGPLMRAVADTLAARFNPVAVRGEVSGFARAASGHCYFSLKDDSGQVRCAMFRRSAEQLTFAPRDGQLVEARGRLDVYGPRGDLQLIVDTLRVAGQGSLFEQFLRLKSRLEAEGLFDVARKRVLPEQPRALGLVTSLGAAALRDVVTSLARRVPHLPVLLFPASVQGAGAPQELVLALEAAYQRHQTHGDVDVLLLVRGGGSLEDLWAFNDEQVVRAVTRAPMPVICGVGHETDFTLSDFAADLRAPTPTAAAELCSPSRDQRLGELDYLGERLSTALNDALDRRSQRLDWLGQRLGRPSARLHGAGRQLTDIEHRLGRAMGQALLRGQARVDALAVQMPQAVRRSVMSHRQRLDQAATALSMMDPQLVLKRGYALLTDRHGQVVTRIAQAPSGQTLHARLSDGQLDVKVL
ncbi:MAG: exodeoxyribonuclease VII large subunit [Burkholderiales bacterium]|nr:MAG: exodeoxyribonuclease VII large subunit [Burkholderiales bacterium]